MRAALVLLSLAAPLAAKPVPLVELVADPIPLTTVMLKRGPVDVRVSLGFDKALLLNLKPAEELGLKPFPLIGKFKVKNPQIPGGEAVIRGNFISGDVGGTGRQKLPTIWIDKDIVVPPQQGIVSALAFDAERVRIRNPQAPGGGRLYRLLRAGRGDAEIKTKVGGETLRLILDFTSERSVMNARAAALLEREGLVRRSGQVGLWRPVPAFAVPVELLRPQPGATLLGLPIREPVVRITRARAEELDARAARGISGDSDDDPDAIVITAEKDKSRGREPWVLIGRDVLRFCETVELDRPGAAWELTCLFPQG